MSHTNCDNVAMARRISLNGATKENECVTLQKDASETGMNQIGHIPDRGPPKWRSQRYILAYLLFGGMMNMYFHRVNFSIAVVCMVNHTALSLFRASSSSNASHHDHMVLTSNQSDHRNGAHFSTLSDDFTNNFTDLPVNLSFDSSSIFMSSHANQENRSDAKNASWNEDTGTVRDEPSRCSAGHLTSQEKAEDGPLLWDKEQQGLLLGAMFWTYMIIQVPGNHLVRRAKKKTVVTLSMTLLTATTMLKHGAALWSPWAVFAVKLVQGGALAFAFISMYGMWVKWAPPHERATLISLAISGQMLGNVLVFPVSALLCKYGFLGGWPSVFYVFGIIGFVWVALFFFISAESPSTHRFITVEEREYIESSLAQSAVIHAFPFPIQPKTPWKAILTSPAVWAIMCAHVSYTWGLFLAVSTFPQYMHEVLKFDIKSNGVFNMLPYIVVLCTTPAAGQISDFVLRKKILRILWTRRMCIIISNLIPAVCLSAMSFLNCTQWQLAVTLLVIGVGATGFSISGVLVNPYDIAPRFATVILTLSNTMACIPGILVPYAVAAITKDQSREQWQIMFFLTSGLYVAGTLGFCLMSREEIQIWAKENKSEIDGIAVESEEEKLKQEEEENRQSEEMDIMI